MNASSVGRNEPCPCNSGKKFKNCCLRRTFDHGVPQPRPVPGDGASHAGPPKTPQRRSSAGTTITEVTVDYVIFDDYGKAEVTYGYPIGTRIIMADGNVLPVEYLLPGMRFRLEDGGVATVTRAEEPKVREHLPPKVDAEGNAPCRVIGRVKYTGYHLRLDFALPGEVIRTPPGHRFWSETRREWAPIESFKRGELLCNEHRRTVPIQWIGPIHVEYGELYNFEVEDFHTYFVGGGPSGAIWSHNGLGMGCSVPKAAIDEALEKGVINETSKIRAGIAGIAEYAKHHIFPRQFAEWFAARNIVVDKYLVEIDRVFHKALHSGQALFGKGGWYTHMVMDALHAKEAEVGELGARQIKEIVSGILTRLGIPIP